MANTAPLGTRVPLELLAKMDEVANAMQRNRAWVVEQALKQYLAEQAQFLAAIEEGRRDAKAGRVKTWEQVEVELDAVEAKYSIQQ